MVKTVAFVFFYLTILYFSDSNFYQCIIYGLSLWFIIDLIYNLGERIILLNSLAFIGILQWLLGAAISESSGIPFAVSFENYYSFAIPSTIFFIIGLKIPNYFCEKKHKYIPALKRNIEFYYSSRHNEILLYYWIGLVCWFLVPFVPSSLNLLVQLFSYLLIIALQALLFCNLKDRKLYFVFGFLAIMLTTVFRGMIGLVVFLSFIFYNLHTIVKPKTTSFFRKFMIVIVGLFCLLILQSVKTEYRTLTWVISGTDGSADREILVDPKLFFDLIISRIIDVNLILNVDMIGEFVTRFNQGFTISQTMNYVPAKELHANGELTLMGPLLAFVPRIIWPTKPEIGTQSYFLKYTGIELSQFNSVTLGAFGDAYVDFGYYAFVFLFFYGLLFGQLYVYFFKYNSQSPFKLLWGHLLVMFLLSFPEVSVSGLLNMIFKFMLFFVCIRFLQNIIFKLKAHKSF